MSYTIRNVGTVTAPADSQGACGPSDVTITFSDNVAADEFLGVVICGLSAILTSTGTESFVTGPPGSVQLIHPNIDLPSNDVCGINTPHSVTFDSGGGAASKVVHAGDVAFPYPNPCAIQTQFAALLGPITAGDTATIRTMDDFSASNAFSAYIAMLVAVKTVPALNNPDLGFSNDGAPDYSMGGYRGLDVTPGDNNDAATATETVTAFAGTNPHLHGGRTARTSGAHLLLAVFAALSLDVPIYTAGWTEELAMTGTIDGGDARLSVVVKELGTDDFNDYDVTATWSGPVHNSASLQQLTEDLPPGVHVNIRLGFQ